MPRREEVEQLKGLLTLREGLLNNLSRLREPIKELKSHGDPQIAKMIEHSSQQGTIEGTLKALGSIEAKVDGVGKCIAGQVIVDTNEFKNI